jgi:hypothetical protein
VRWSHTYIHTYMHILYIHTTYIHTLSYKHTLHTYIIHTTYIHHVMRGRGAMRGVQELYTDAMQGEPSEIISVLKAQAAGRGTDALASMLQDVIKQRRTEIDFLNGYVSDEGRKVGVPTPFCDAASALVRSAGVGEIRPATENLLKVVAAMAPEHQALIEQFHQRCVEIIGDEATASALLATSPNEVSDVAPITAARL